MDRRDEEHERAVRVLRQQHERMKARIEAKAATAKHKGKGEPTFCFLFAPFTATIAPNSPR